MGQLVFLTYWSSVPDVSDCTTLALELDSGQEVPVEGSMNVIELFRVSLCFLPDAWESKELTPIMHSYITLEQSLHIALVLLSHFSIQLQNRLSLSHWSLKYVVFFLDILYN